jgi:hypothetical protein
MHTSWRGLWLALGFLSSSALALPPIEPDTLVAPSGVVYWDVSTSGAMRDGSTTQTRGSRQVVIPEKIQDGRVCHNFGETCACTKAKFRIAPSIESRWHVIVKGEDREVAECPSGVKPTGPAGGKQGMSREEAAAKREAIRAMKRAKRNEAQAP